MKTVGGALPGVLGEEDGRDRAAAGIEEAIEETL